MKIIERIYSEKHSGTQKNDLNCRHCNPQYIVILSEDEKVFIEGIDEIQKEAMQNLPICDEGYVAVTDAFTSKTIWEIGSDDE